MTARDEILARIRRATAAGGGQSKRRAMVEQRLAEPQRHVVPARTAVEDRPALLALFRHYLTDQSATIISARSPAEVPGAIAAFLGSGASLRLGADRFLAGLPWNTAPSLALKHGRSQAEDEVGLSRAVAGIAETGTLMLLSGPDNPVTLAFLPATHIVVLDAADVVGSYEDALAVLRKHTRADGMPRTVNLVSGPSRTADIIGILVTGAHGPRRLAVVLVGSEEKI